MYTAIVASTLLLTQISVPQCEDLLSQHKAINWKSAELLVELQLQQMTRWNPATDDLIDALERAFEQRRKEMKRLARDVAKARKTELVPVAESQIWEVARHVAWRGLYDKEKELEALRADTAPIGPDNPPFGMPGMLTERLSPAAEAKIPGVKRKIQAYRHLVKALNERLANDKKKSDVHE
jgi:hypothetical protein